MKHEILFLAYGTSRSKVCRQWVFGGVLRERKWDWNRMHGMPCRVLELRGLCAVRRVPGGESRCNCGGCTPERDQHKLREWRGGLAVGSSCLGDQPDGAVLPFGHCLQSEDGRFRWENGVGDVQKRRARLGFKCMDVDAAKCLRDQTDRAVCAFGHC